METFSIAVDGGRSVDVTVAGPPDGLPFVFHTGTPSGLATFRPMIDAAAGRGLRYIQYARPGYGGSAPLPGRRVASAVADLAAVLDHLGAGRFITAGWSGGGPHALACAALLPGRCAAAASIAGVAPRQADGLDWLAGMAAENVAEFGAAERGEAELTALLSAAAEVMAAVTGEQVAAELGGLVTAADRNALTGEFADYLAALFRSALSTGIAGWRDDDLAFTADWGFDPGQITVPVAVWQGDQDAMVPFAHGQWLADRIPGARAHLLSGDGHLTLILRHFGAILDDLAELGR
ncbi:MAG TPA: alpha/beta hydrolase [Streptosporangiaceae bacterium]|nr:alpha/beta hydrolase [Streptosporangiaceae bacterium]